MDYNEIQWREKKDFAAFIQSKHLFAHHFKLKSDTLFLLFSSILSTLVVKFRQTVHIQLCANRKLFVRKSQCEHNSRIWATSAHQLCVRINIKVICWNNFIVVLSSNKHKVVVRYKIFHYNYDQIVSVQIMVM